MLMPALVFLFDWRFRVARATQYEHLRAIVASPDATHPVRRACCRSSIGRTVKYTLYDGLQVKHLNELLNTFCYGGAIVGSWRRPICCGGYRDRHRRVVRFRSAGAVR
jgi:hypothetical protein